VSSRAAATNRRRLNLLVARIYARYRRGYTLEECGRLFGGRTAQSVWHLFRNRGLKCRQIHSAPSYEAAAAKRRARLDGIARRAHVDYERPMALRAVARKYDMDASTLRAVFRRNKLRIRPFKKVPRQANGSPIRYVPFTLRELDRLIARASRILIPAELKYEWRHWSLKRRGWFIARMRKRLRLPGERPETPFSANIEPFAYGSPRAHELARRTNAGCDSRTKRVQIHLNSQGVIYKGRLYFWVRDHASRKTGAYYIGPWRPDTGRPALHRIIWEETNGRPVPARHVVRFADGNRNNLAPSNLVLATRNDLARENQAAGRTRKSREMTSLLLRHSQKKGHHDHGITLRRLVGSS
jgi:hypothetical protein